MLLRSDTVHPMLFFLGIEGVTTIQTHALVHRKKEPKLLLEINLRFVSMQTNVAAATIDILVWQSDFF
jgi:hypothetical protein